MILEAVIATTAENGAAHLSPLGYRWDGERVLLAPFVPSQTLDNLRRSPAAVLNFTDDVRIIAGCLTGRRDWPTRTAETVDGWRLGECLAHFELAVVEHADDPVRPRFWCEVVHRENHAPFRGFNRAQAAVVEAAILVSRLEFLDPQKVASDIEYLSIAVDKTAGARELEAWQWLLDAIKAHPRHRAFFNSRN